MIYIYMCIQPNKMFYSSTGTEKYKFTAPPGRRNTIGKPCVFKKHIFKM